MSTGVDDALKRAKRATITPKTDARFKGLAEYISALAAISYLQNLTAEQITELQQKLAHTSIGEREEILSAVASGAHYFHLSSADIESIQKTCTDLTFEKRAELITFMTVAAGTAILDPSGVLEAHIEIDDHSSRERERRPYARVHYRDDQRRERVETVDVIESVRRNPFCIAHPVIAHAIRHWQRVIEATMAWKPQFKHRPCEIAQKNLRSLAEALAAAPANTGVSKELNLYREVKPLDRYDSLLKTAWDHLKSRGAQNRSDDDSWNPEAIIENLSHRLSTASNLRDECRNIIDFLRGPGLRFVGGVESGKARATRVRSRRPPWKVFKHAFAAWLRNLKPATVQQYLKRGRQQSKSLQLMGTYRADTTSVLRDLLSTPLVHVKTRSRLNRAVRKRNRASRSST